MWKTYLDFARLSGVFHSQVALPRKNDRYGHVTKKSPWHKPRGRGNIALSTEAIEDSCHNTAAVLLMPIPTHNNLLNGVLTVTGWLAYA